ncbi:MAG: glycosyltransferase family 61 protein [Proteobacteria bacterium]|nr:glycosyltransferase family 61 protein [Pseudomonadota bacterium]
MNILDHIFHTGRRSPRHLALPRTVRKAEFSKVPTLDALLEHDSPPSYWLPFPSDTRTLPPARPLVMPATDEIEGIHTQTPDMPHIVVAAFSNVVVSGRSIVGSDTETFSIAHPVMPVYQSMYLENGWTDGFPHSLSGKAERPVDETCVLVSHFNSGVYGHWLLECLPKLLLLRTLLPLLPPVSILLPETSKEFIRKWCELLVPEIPILEYDDSMTYVVCKSLLIPGQLCSRNGFFHPIMNDYLEDVVGLAAAPQRTAEHLYITRECQSRFRFMRNRDEIEDIAREKGLTLISPETLPLGEQISLFANCKTITGEFGSALHNSMFAPLETPVLALNWIAGYQSRVAHLRSQPTGYLLPDDGPLKWDRELADIARGYTIDPLRFSETLDKHLSRDTKSVAQTGMH